MCIEKTDTKEMWQPGAIARVAIQCPVDKLFDYAVGECGAGLRAGCRVRVPFGRREVVGLVMEVAKESDVPPGKLKRVVALIDDDMPLVGEVTLRMMRWAARYYSAPVGETIAMFPRLLRGGRPARAEAVSRWFASAGEDALAGLRGNLQRKLLARLVAAPEGLDAPALDTDPGGAWRPAAKVLEGRGLLARQEMEGEPQPGPERLHEIVLEKEQQIACDAITAALGKYEAFLLEGVTASGKTEVFIVAARQVLKAGGQVLVLVPEIALTPQVLARFRRSLPAPVVVMHSGLGDKERMENWLFARSGKAGVVIGTRSSAFVEMPNLGLVVVDEEHDTSFKEGLSGRLRYSARDCAVMRAYETKVPVVLASATPSLESMQNVNLGRYRHLVLRRRAVGAQIPKVRIIDLNKEPSMSDGLSYTLINAMERHLGRGDQVLIFLNRRGFAPVLLCGDCGWSSTCPSCDAHSVLHKTSRTLMCHHCGHREPAPVKCPSCGSASGMFAAGEGTQRVEERLIELFPQYPLVRMDRDAIRGRGEMEDALERMRSGDARILLGTQMVVKGHDFSGVTLVGVVGTDAQLYNVDFRSVERLGQTLIQVAGRAGRGEKPGVVMVQTRFPHHHAITALKAGGAGYREVATIELEAREETGLPPFGHMAVALARSPQQGAAMDFLRELMARAPQSDAVTLFGPMPTVIEKLGGEFRAQIVLSSKDRSALQRFLQSWVPQAARGRAPHGLHWVVDVDPLQMH